MRAKQSQSAVRYARSLKNQQNKQYVLRLYVTGVTPASTRAIANLKALCESRLKGCYQLEVIDIFQHPELAHNEQIVAAPTLVKLLPPPLRRFIGDMENLEAKLLGLDLHPRDLLTEP